MHLFRRFGRQVELFRQIAKQTAADAAITHCRACEAWIPEGGDYCPYCGHQPPHTVLGVAPDAPESVVKAAAREQLKTAHPDHGGSQSEFQRIKQARDRLLEQ
ncbi:MAG: J domain-containing protein [Halobacteriales archaeon]